MPQSAPLRPGDPARLGAYRLIGRVGEGGQGTVYLGTAGDRAGAAAGGRVAIKLLHARLSSDAKARSRFAAELAVARRVAPFCTARIVDADVQGDTPYIVSEYIDGRSLYDVVADEGPRRGPALHRLAIGTITALAAIHQAGVVHRDFKPSNVLLAADGPRVIDFGIARALDATGTLSSTAVGTPSYMAPEQISGGPIGPAADVFAWGCTIAFAASGRPPFGRDSIPAVMNRILNRPPDLGVLDQPLRGLVAECLAKDAAGRPTAQAVLLRLLGHDGVVPAGSPSAAVLTEGVEAASPAHAPPPYRPLVRPDAPPPRRERRVRPGVLAGTGTAAFVALVVFGTYALVHFGPFGGDTPTTTPGAGGRVGGTLTMAASSTPSAIDPSNASFGAELFAVKQLFTGLTEVTPDGRVVRRLAQDIRPDGTCRSWSITVRPGTTFSNGEPVDARAFVRGWTRAATSASGYSLFVMDEIKGYREINSGQTDKLSGVSATGDAIRVELTQPDCEFDRRLATTPFVPVPSGAGAANNTVYNNKPIGNGPFKVESYTPNSKLTLVRNDAWFAGRTKLDRVDIELSTSTSNAVAAFDAGRSDWADVSPDQLAAAKARHASDGELRAHNVDGIDFLIPVTTNGPLRSRQAREAISYAINRQALDNEVFAGTRPPVTGLIPPALPGFHRPGSCPSCERSDPVKAKQLANAAGLLPGTKITFVTRTSGASSVGNDQIQQQLESVLGLNVTRHDVSSNLFSDFTKTVTGRGATGMGRMSWLGDYPSAYNFLHSVLGAEQTAHLSDWRDSTFDRLMRQAVAEPDAATRDQLVQQAESVALDDMALIPLWDITRVLLVNSKKFVGLGPDYDGDPTLATAALKS